MCALAKQKPFTSTQEDIDEVRLLMVHCMDEEGKNRTEAIGALK